MSQSLSDQGTDSDQGTEGVAHRTSRGGRSRIPRFATTTAFYITLVVVAIVIIFGILSPGNRFLTLSNFQALGMNSAGLMLLAIGLTYVIATGNIDLSVGANLVLSSVVAAKVIIASSGTSAQVVAGDYQNEALAIGLGLAAGIITGTVVGVINGLLVTRLGVNSFVISLGTLGVATGVALVLTNGANVPYLPMSLQRAIGHQEIMLIPIPLVIALSVGAVAWVWLRRTAFGRHVLAVGSSASGARRSGVAVNSVVIRAFVISGFMAGIAGGLDLTKFGTTAISGHETDMLQALSAVIIGGTSLFGGRASMGGSIIAVFIPISLLTGFVMLGVPPFYQFIAVGTILVVAVYIDGLRRTRD